MPDTTTVPATEADSTTRPKPVYARETVIAAMFGIPVATLRTRRNRFPKAPPFIKVGRTVLYRVTDVERWIKSEGKKGGAQ